MTFVYGCSLPPALVVSVLPVYAAAEESVLPVTGHYVPPVYLYHLCIYKKYSIYNIHKWKNLANNNRLILQLYLYYTTG